MEIEAKYRATKRIRARQIEALDFAPYTLGRRTLHELRDTLLDTTAQALGRQRHSLRVREDGALVFLTLKGAGTVTGSTHQREEVEVALDEGNPLDPASWPADFLARVRALVGDEPLHPLLHIQNHRQTWDIFHAGERVAEIALDRGTIRAGQRRARLHEIEVELKGEGREEELSALVGCLLAALPLEPEPRSKAERGRALLAKRPPFAPATPMRPDAPLAEAGRGVLARHLDDLLRLLPSEGERISYDKVHAARVATRHLRAVLDQLGATVYEPRKVRKLQKGLQELAAALGTVRDADVFLRALDEYAAPLSPQARAGLKPLRQDQRRQRKAGRVALRALLARPRTTRYLDRLARFVREPGAGVALPRGDADSVPPTLVCHLAGGLLWQRYEAVRAYEGVVPDAPLLTLHRLRVAIKQLRYTLRLFRKALGPDVKPLVALLTAAQDHLGALHDADLAIALVDHLLADHPANEPLRHYRATRAAAHAELCQGVEPILAPLFAPAFRHQLAALIAAL